ncbi:MAG: TolC family protein [Cyanomargarita calcarea GSE-NOS-MK-12-04C]|uniref:TolC family protein n=1 Tax=Cyanomargarita calcarea GSE-NOS-MK-12-04C TaxID=2839659 RepID=A0A951QM32_9CYAN|nr:TolC family protein [Cyanomargarita calcarea GSE-NOS-MK-12-04C]
MKRQQIFHSFLPGVTAAVLTTQPAWAETLNVSQLAIASASPSVSTSTYRGALLADIINGQPFITSESGFPSVITLGATTIADTKPISSNKIAVRLRGKTGVPVTYTDLQDDGITFNLTSNSNPALPPWNGFSNQQQSNLVIPEQESKNIVVPTSISRLLSVVSSQQPVASRKKADTSLQAFLQTASSAKLLQEVQLCPPLANSKTILSSRNCSPPNGMQNLTAQKATPPSKLPITPAPAITPRVPVTPSTSNPGQIPDFLNQNPNPLQFPTKPEEVRLQTNQPITLAQALELARRNSRELQVSLLTLDERRAAVQEAQAALLPTLGISGDLSRGQSASGQLSVQRQNDAQAGVPPQLRRETATDSPTTSFSGQAQLSYNIYTSGSRQASISEAEERQRLQELDVERLSEQIRLDVSTDYYNLQQADEQVRINQSAVTNSAASLRDAQALERAGVGTRFDVLQSQVNLANAQQELTNARSQQEIARRRLARRLSLSQAVNITAADPVRIAGLWNQTLENSIVQAYQNRPELQQQLAQRNISEQQRRRALSSLGPQVSLIASYDIVDQFNDSVSLTDGYSVALRANLNLFDGGAARARAAQAKANIAIAETQFASQRDQVRFEVEQAFFEQQSSLENVQTSNTALEQARESLRLARLRFQAGVGTQTDVINAENALTRAEGNRVTAILNYNRALANLQRYVTSRSSR